jgi:1-acyl-sn-glycerol-3-phosphate acyltransferase
VFLSFLKKIAGYLFSNWLAITFYVLFYTLYDIRVEGITNFTASGATLITINHKRDLDVPIMSSTLHVRKTLFSNKRRMHFIAREDILQSGFLTAHFPIFGFAGPVIHRINLKPIMIILQAHPISHLIRQRIGPLIRELQLRSPTVFIEEVFTRKGLSTIKTLLDDQHTDNIEHTTVNDFLGYKFRRLHQQTIDIKSFKTEYARSLRERTLKKVREQIHEIVRILDDGNICMLAPEGQISTDGRFWPVKSGLFRLVSMTTGNVKILPVNTTYDFMTDGRRSIYVSIGNELADIKALKKIELEELVQERIVTLGIVTISQLGSEFLLNMLDNNDASFDEQECVETISRRVEEIKLLNVNLDKRLHSLDTMKKRIRGFLRYCVNKGILEKESDGRFVINIRQTNSLTSGNFNEYPVQHSDNELKSLLEFYK